MPKIPDEFLSTELLEVNRTLGWMDLVIGSIEDAVCVTDQSGQLVFANQHFAHLIGMDRVFVLGKRFTEVFAITKTRQPLVEYRNTVTPLSNTADGINGIYERSREDGVETYKISSRSLPNINQTVYLIQDISREYEFAQNKNKFVDLASHQLRTPMTGIMTYAHMLRDGFAGELSADQARLVDTIVDSSERMISLVNGLLSITRAQNNLVPLRSTDLSLPDIFSLIRAETSPRLLAKNIKLKVDLPSDLPRIINDQSIMHEIFSNLVVNAIQYTPDNGRINVTAAASQDTVRVTVADTGIGIPESYRPHVFEQFSRADNALQAHPEGTGLGLYLIKILVAKVGGTICFDSEINKGTSFYVSLPLSLSD